MVTAPAEGHPAPGPTALRPSPLLVVAMSNAAAAAPVPTPPPPPPTDGPPSTSSPLVVLAMPPPQLGMSMAVGGSAEPLKRKRGRPRKYVGPEGGGAAGSPVNMQLGLQPPHSSSGGSPHTPGSGKKRGRPLGSGKKHQLASLGTGGSSPLIGIVGDEGLHVLLTTLAEEGKKSVSLLPGALLAGSTAGQGFIPHILTIAAGEDVANKIMSFAQHGPRAVCVISANGAISNVTLRQQSSSGGNVTYEGRYEILSLMGSFLPTDTGGGSWQRTGGLSVSLAGSDGRVIGGGVAGLLMAASPIQVVVGSFMSDASKPAVKVVHTQETTIGLSPASQSGVVTPVSAPRPPKLEQKSPAHHQALSAQTAGGAQSSNLMGSFQPMGSWVNPALRDPRRTDINIS